MRVLAVSNFKGGCGKTTSAVSLSACMAEVGLKSLIIDLDPQLSATQWLGLPQDSRALFDALAGDGRLEDAITKTTCDGLEAIAGSRWMIGLDKALAGEVGAELTLSRKLGELPALWDVVVLDCPPATGLISLSALCATSDLVIPLEPTTLNTQGLVHMFQTVRQVQERLNPRLKVRGILPCRVDRRTKIAREIIDELRQRFGALIFETTIRTSAKLCEAASFAQPITLYDPKGNATNDYRKVTKELIERMSIHEQVQVAHRG